MLALPVSPTQLAVIEQSLDSKIFLEGPAGCGKTTAGVKRLLYLLEKGISGSSILLWVPQRFLAEPYLQVLRTPGVTAGGMVAMLTVGGLAKRLIELFWPMVAQDVGFGHPDELPTFLTLETAQYYMADLVRPLLDEGYFETVVMERNRLYSQILDNLNKAAVVGFPYNEIGERLKAAWVGEVSQARIYQDAQFCATRFREYCLSNNLLDFSLQLEVFIKYLWPNLICRQYLKETYRHLIVDNLEEDTPAAHELLRHWLPDFDSALLIYDHDGGYRRFLGADPDSAYTLKPLCPIKIETDRSFVISTDMAILGSHLAQALNRNGSQKRRLIPLDLEKDILAYAFSHFYPEMLDWVADQVAGLVSEEGVTPGEIVILSPFLNDALRFALEERLERRAVPFRTHRPSRSLREEAITRCLLTIAALAHPQWGIRPSQYEFAYALVQIIAGLDLVRAQLLAQTVFRSRADQLRLSSYDLIKPEMQERITYRAGELYERFRRWLEEYARSGEEELDYFFSRLFGELLSQPGYSFHMNFYAGEITANLIESIRKFRWVANRILAEKSIPAGKKYLQMVQDGVISALYIRSWQIKTDDAVLIAPAYTFLMRNIPVDYQFWLDIGSRGWFERLYQPLTHPYVLSCSWSIGRIWTDTDEIETSEEALYRLAMGLIRRCRKKIYLGLSELSEQGYENRGPLLRAIDRVLRQSN